MRLATLALIMSAVFAIAPSSAWAQGELTWEDVHLTLDPHGTWVDVAEYGEAWRPTGLRSSWRPYTEGHWERDGEDWLWVSDHDWGWIPFHYGRWYSHANFGWVWIPGFDYAPSWTVWQDAEAHSAWAPLPPGPCWQGQTFVGVIPAFGWVYAPRAAFRSRVVYFRPYLRAPRARFVHRAYGPYLRSRHRVVRHNPRQFQSAPSRRVVRTRRGRVGPEPRRPYGVRSVDPNRGQVVSRRSGNGARRFANSPSRSAARRRRVSAERSGSRGRDVRRSKPGIHRTSRPTSSPRRSARPAPSLGRSAPKVRRATPVRTRGSRQINRARPHSGRKSSARVGGRSRGGLRRGGR
ncbi:MAG: DUF6600 domain-containing protein [Myxococcota bacterium]